ncbi:uncharacterized protein K444DRAFT_635575 [Hyaloscypha bicolor E]|uniref:Uncharacterized protein n=1 Tax=Hyaloscypha bicolor E TaxID=1095630 RepID=A0A2J6SR96_9HELO|nr:uncharacterized protein K444DRAFT_635575 [Hyaloscypha bicolor E]PMD53223.1 hypothetical protein K444DRAFT_635575 [Hyaloscypha bicolor E]
MGQAITPFARPTATACQYSNCSVSATRGEKFGWEQKNFNTTIVAATVVTIVNTNLQTSRLTTIFNALLAGYTLPPTNSDGTVIQRITYTTLGQVLTTELAFPSSFCVYVDAYTWNDVAPLRDCWIAVTSPFIPHWTAQFLTHTSTSFESNGDVSTSSAAPAISPPPPAPSSGPSPQLPVGQTFSPPSLPENSEPSSLSSSSYQLPPTAQSTNPTTPVSKLSLSTNGVPPGSTPQQSTLELGGSAVVTSTGVTNGVSFPNIYTTTVPSTSQLVTSNGTLVAQLYGFKNLN